MNVDRAEPDETPRVATLTCGECQVAMVGRRIGTDVRISNAYTVGHRACPRCDRHHFVVFEYYGDVGVVDHFPRAPIAFDRSHIPDRVARSFEQALTCSVHRCYEAAALMVRRTLEEVCEERTARGSNLKDRISALRGSVVLPPALLDAMTALRLLGNDAAHVEARTYSAVSGDEVNAAIAVTTEILKAIYQYDDLVSKLRSLQKPSPSEDA